MRTIRILCARLLKYICYSFIVKIGATFTVQGLVDRSPHIKMDPWFLCYHALAAMNTLCYLLVLPSSYVSSYKMHQHMSQDELVDVFGVRSYSEVPEYEIVQPIREKRRRLRPSRDQTSNQSSHGVDDRSYLIRAFGKDFLIDLEPDNYHVFPDNLVIHHWHSTNHTSLRAQRVHRDHGHFLGHVRGQEVDSLVALSEHRGLLNGLVTSKDTDFFIRPVPVKFLHFAKPSPKQESQQGSKSSLHLVFKRSDRKSCTTENTNGGEGNQEHWRRLDRRSIPRHDRKYIEVMIVSDSTMFDYHGNELEGYLKTIMSIAAATFRSPSISVNISLHVVRCLVLEAGEVDPVIVPDSQTSLRNFCDWQKRVYPENVADPQHFDIATLITRHDLSREDILTGSTVHGVLGLANMASACIKSRRCSIVEDNGLATGLTVAHEIGHALGMEHDGAGNRCPTSGHIMASVTSSGAGAYTWSKCSVGYLNAFLRSPVSHCLSDEPDMNKNLSLYRGWRPGQLFHRNEQCRFLYADSDGSCSHRQTDCEKLWCLRSNDGEQICSTNRSPPADGTECGEGKWCIGGHCVSYGDEGPEPIHGEWSEWEPTFSDCSRTCGGGVRTKRRHCNSPTPAFGGSHCQGEDTEIEICNVHDCQNSAQYQFAEEQCGSQDNIPYKDQLTMWKPYTDRSRTSGDNFCQHSCVSYELKKVVKFGEFVDGTRCDVINPLADNTAMCVEGMCKHFGCDLSEDSGRRFDKCGVCDGDNSACEIQRGVSQTRASSDYTTVLDIPIGSTFINITQSCGDCHFALMTENQYVFGGAGERGKSRAYTDGNDVISYVGGVPESILIRGPTSSKITIQVYTSTDDVSDDFKSHAVLWVFYKPVGDRPEYSWSIVSSPCSKTCGFGLLVQDVICRELLGTRDGRTVELFRCLHLKKPELVTEPCNEFDCPHRWEAGEWGDCSASCGVGVRVRQAYCVQENTAGLIEIFSHEVCDEIDVPLLEEPCDAPACIEDESVTCNETIFASEGSFTSPNHPGNYPTNIDCMTRIKVNPGYWVYLTFEGFELESSPDCIFDYVEIFQDHEDITSTSITKLCGAKESTFSVIVRHSSASVLFHSDSFVTRRGFVANFGELDP